MNIQNAKYYKNVQTDEESGINCIINGENSCVPISTENQHYQEILRQVDAGELTIEPADDE